MRARALAACRLQVKKLNDLLSKSVAYSEFLANKIKKEGEEGTVAVADGSVKGTGLRQPKLVKGQMRPYQLVGVHWLVGLYENGLNGILGDEMGLGKTVQSIAMLAHLTEQGVPGPFMVVGPLSTLYNWANEFKRWTPDMDAVIYHGTKAERKDIRGTHYRGKSKCPVMITSYEIVIRDIADLRKIPWKFIIIDEGHRLKNMNCRLIRELKTIAPEQSCNRLLLTGTPLQNNLTELWSLLNFLLPSIFDDLDAFQAWFDFDFTQDGTEQKVLEGEMTNQVVTKLHQILRPFLLRRLKADVEIGLPKKFEYILFAWMTDWQQMMYQDLLAKNLADSSGKQLRLNNVLMQLRKCCNHPYLFEWPLDAAGNETVDDILIEGAPAPAPRPPRLRRPSTPSCALPLPPLPLSRPPRAAAARARSVGQDAAARPHPRRAVEAGRPPDAHLLADDAHARRARGLPHVPQLEVPPARRHRLGGGPPQGDERVPGREQRH